jgi:hypothetical protein
MIPRLKAALSNSEKQTKVMLMKSDLENFLKEKTAYYGFVKVRITKQ